MITELLADFPPCVVRLLARRGRGFGARRLTHEEVATAGGLSARAVRRISSKLNWSELTIGEADRFLLGCGIRNHSDLWRHRAFLRRSLDPRKTGRPLASLTKRRRGRSQKAPPPELLVRAALGK
jgi:hypothetical protein